MRRRGLRENTDLSVITLQPMLMPNAGRAGSDWMADQLVTRGITCRVGAKVERVDAGRLVFADVTIDAPSAERAHEKAEFEREHLERWFGDSHCDR